MNIEEITVSIGPDGKVQLEVRGVKGDGCLDLTRALEAMLGGDIEAREMTPEASENARRSAGQDLSRKQRS